MIDPQNINSGEEYAKVVIKTITDEENQLPVDERMPEGILNYLKEYIEVKADKYYTEYILGKRETFLFSDVEMMEMFNKAGEAYVGDMLDNLVDKDMLQVSIDESGELVYSLSEAGKKVTEKKPKKTKNNGKNKRNNKHNNS